jgi:hypothetical protein
MMGWILFGVMALAAVGLAFAPVTERQDEGIVLTYPWLIAQGKMMYRDFWMLYPPGIVLALGALVKIGVPALVAERGLSVCVRLGYVLLVNQVVNGSWRRFSLVAAPACFGLMALASEARASAFYAAVPLVLAGLVCLGRYPYAAAALFFFAGTLRYELGIAGLAAMVVLAVLQAALKRSDRRQLAATVGLALVLAVFYAGLDLMTGGRAIQEILVEPVLHLKRTIPLIPIQYFPWDLQLVALLVLAPIGLAAAGLIRRRPEVTASSVAIALTLPYFLQRADRSHLYPLAALAIPWLLVSLQSLGASGWPWRLLRGWLALGVGFVEMVIVLSICLYTSPISPLTVRHKGPLVAGRGKNVVLAASPVEARDYRGLEAYLGRRASSRDRVFVWPSHMRYADDNDTALYFALAMTPATSHLEINPGIESRADIQRTIVRQLAGCRWVVLWKPTFPGQQMSGDTAAPVVQRYLLAHYRSVMSNTSFTLLRAR